MVGDMGMENGKMGAKVVLHFAAAISLEMVVLYNLTNQLTSSSLQWLVIHLWSRCPLLIQLHINLSDSQTDESATLPSHNFRRQKHKSHDNKHHHYRQQPCKWILSNAGISYWHFSSIRWNHSHESCFPQLSNTTHGGEGGYSDAPPNNNYAPLSSARTAAKPIFCIQPQKLVKMSVQWENFYICYEEVKD